MGERWEQIRSVEVRQWRVEPLIRVLNESTGTVHLSRPIDEYVYKVASLVAMPGTPAARLFREQRARVVMCGTQLYNTVVTSMEPTCKLCRRRARQDYDRWKQHLPDEGTDGFNILVGG
jgi:hypothetical protein